MESNLEARKYLRVKDVVSLTGLSRSAIMVALWSGNLQGHQVGRAWLIPVAAVDAWIVGSDAVSEGESEIPAGANQQGPRRT